MSAAVPCAHLDQIAVVDVPPAIAGCEDCPATGDRWVHFRMCTTCGKIGCCDSSPNRHARAHAGSADHPIVRSAEKGEDWSYCFVEDVTFVVGT
jgi:uncharacterized UBP type Zn finger protein